LAVAVAVQILFVNRLFELLGKVQEGGIENLGQKNAISGESSCGQERKS